MSYVLVALFVVLYPFSAQMGLRGDHPWQLLTYGFAHGNIAHLLINCLAAWSFGRALEKLIGPWWMLIVFVLGSMWAGFVQQLVTPDVPIYGASAGILTMATVYAWLKPEAKIAITVLLMPAMTALAFIVGFSALCLVTGWLPQVAHAAHMAGILFGFLLVIPYGTVDNRVS